MASRGLEHGVTPGLDWIGGEVRAMRPLIIKGTEGMVTRFSKCCRPIPGDPVVGIITSGRGVMIHTQTCRNITERKFPADNFLDVQWEPGIEGEFPVEISVVVEDRRGVLATVATVIQPR